MRTRNLRLPLLTLAVASLLASRPSAAQDARIDFTRDIRPILSNTCFTCHGPDQTKRETDLRLDTKAGAFADLGGYSAIRPGDIGASELLKRITSDDDELRMPPPDSSRQLTKQQIRLLRDWIDAGAPWEEHWAFVPPVRPQPPKTRDARRVNAIDDFVSASLARHGRRLARAATKETLIRRVSLDLTGLPPTLKEIDDFLADESDEAYEKLVDRLLKSERYGERMAQAWLDVARYADTSGYQNDGPRDMWRWRDWVIRAYNQNMPFHQFTVEQLAGDLLDPPLGEPPTDYESAWRGKLITEPGRLDRLIASAFNRNHRGNAEGGIIPEEYQVEYVVDRVDTTATVWLGLTLGCARCHDHKYDSLKQRDFYGMFAYFNNIPEFGRAVKEGNSPPYIKAPTEAQRKQLASLNASIRSAQNKLAGYAVAQAKMQHHWEAQAPEAKHGWLVGGKLAARYKMDGDLDGSPAEHKAMLFGGKPQYVEGKVGRALQLNGDAHVDAGDFADFSYFDAFSITAWIRPEADDGVVLSRMTPVAQGDGYHIRLEDGRVEVNLVKRWLDDSLRVSTKQRVPKSQWRHLAVTYDGTREPTGIRVYLDGVLQELEVKQDFINQTFAASKQPVRIGGGDVSFRGAIDDVRIYARALPASDVTMIATPASVQQILDTPRERRSKNEAKKLRRYFVERVVDRNIRRAHETLAARQAKRKQLLDAIPTLMVMQEMKTPRTTHVLKRGEYDKPGEPVAPSTPVILPPLPADAPKNRLGLARWLVDRRNPLTARVAVNRAWQLHFGAGLVRTSEDFGVQGQPPTHPRLLDWLAVEFMESGWDVKALHRLIVTSATYRQSSQADKGLLAADPHNRWLARGPRQRLSAEIVRDQALAVSGLLKERVGGPSVFPYQPQGLWKEIATDTDYPQSHGDDLYRRSIYTYWKRTVAPPTMSTLDAPSRESCIVRRSRTNTPLQALALMNEVSFVEASRVFAANAIRLGGKSTDERLTHLFRSATGRLPSESELNVLRRSYENHRDDFSRNPAAAEKLIVIGESPAAAGLNSAKLAAFTMVASLILNLDEVISKQ